jgi:hypothetical protein
VLAVTQFDDVGVFGGGDVVGVGTPRRGVATGRWWLWWRGGGFGDVSYSVFSMMAVSADDWSMMVLPAV